MLLSDLLSKMDSVFLLELIYESLPCAKEKDFIVLMRKLSCLVPHEYSISGLAKTNGGCSIKSYDIVNVTYPDEWLDLYIWKN